MRVGAKNRQVTPLVNRLGVAGACAESTNKMAVFLRGACWPHRPKLDKYFNADDAVPLRIFFNVDKERDIASELHAAVEGKAIFPAVRQCKHISPQLTLSRSYRTYGNPVPAAMKKCDPIRRVLLFPDM